ncbi:6687_t:CDS:2 [Diversispora eburnea]|uniref:6687_t:CDS:1 n=1 Tax=Diversispora eburnea TaxID=1213867 RepID=A0A9N9BMR3_9GLOM|nr:6687_t:CDS:2 [Diversispora eburnea]
MESLKDHIRTMEFEPYKPKCVELIKHIDWDDYDKERHDPLKDLNENDELEFVIDEAASNHANGIQQINYNDLDQVQQATFLPDLYNQLLHAS